MWTDKEWLYIKSFLINHLKFNYCKILLKNNSTIISTLQNSEFNVDLEKNLTLYDEVTKLKITFDLDQIVRFQVLDSINEQYNVY